MRIPKFQVLEKDVEKYLRDEIKKRGGIAYKWVSPGRHGVPDRIVVLKGRVIFVEVKTTRGKMTDNQTREMDRLVRLGATYETVYGKEGVDLLLRYIDDGIL